MARSLSSAPQQTFLANVVGSKWNGSNFLQNKTVLKSEFMWDHEEKLYLIRFLVQQEELPDTGEESQSSKRKEEICGDAKKDFISKTILMALVW